MIVPFRLSALTLADPVVRFFTVDLLVLVLVSLLAIAGFSNLYVNFNTCVINLGTNKEGYRYFKQNSSDRIAMQLECTRKRYAK